MISEFRIAIADAEVAELRERPARVRWPRQLPGGWERGVPVDYLRRVAEPWARYADLQGTRPQTVSFGLSDSPVGQLAWILEKFWEWTDPAIRRVLDRRHRIVHWSEFTSGGHFAALEAPGLLVDDIRAFFRLVR
ncbi:pimeloyl-ACP methyl ester carboxylesterase [Kribbella aluminosa]|uniref:Pimeloyl-ACP methyl ester carboxylesterase n=1 Tax=Kribbella aluminosa TaxID=416017 RepID=A0ABS4UUM0_9ACTN|nr:epoxide hydrolase N-terminal domain-containing protein [Kribbella aluminosa]MBP2355337.1 pimeloyl-ACP methyl ester carboxylesterase [Kribbella aluminosa]